MPKLRFKNFTSPWFSRKLGETGTTYTGLQGKSSEDFGHGSARYITYMNVFSNTIANNTQLESVEVDGSQNEVKNGDVFFTTSSETPEEVGMTSVWLNNQPNTYLNSFCFGFRPSTKFNPYFLGYLLRSPTIREKLIFLAQGISRYNISKTRVMDITIQYPNLIEQEKIGSFLSAIDRLIEKQREKVDRIKSLKKGYLQRMFPARGEEKPKFRFKGFSEKWIPHKLGEVVSIQRGGSPRPINQFITEREDGINWIKIGDVSNQSRYITSTQEKITPEGAKSSRSVFKGDLILSNSMSFGRPYILTIDGCIHDGWLLIRNDKNTFHLEFLLQLLSSNLVLEQYKSFAAGGVVNNLNSDLVQKVIVSFPPRQEQEKIANFFIKIEDILVKNQKQLESYEQMKKSYLQRIFAN